FESILLCAAAVVEFLQHALSLRTEKKICHQQRGMRMGRIGRNGGAADVGRNQIHGDPLHWRSLGSCKQGVRLKDRRRRDDLSRGDVVNERRGLDRIKLYFLPFELSNCLLAFGLKHRSDDLVTSLTDADAHFPLKLRVKETVEILRDRLFGHKRRVVSKAYIRLSGEGPINEAFVGPLLAVFRIFVQIRRVVRPEQFSIAQEYKTSL